MFICLYYMFEISRKFMNAKISDITPSGHSYRLLFRRFCPLGNDCVSWLHEKCFSESYR